MPIWYMCALSLLCDLVMAQDHSVMVYDTKLSHGLNPCLIYKLGLMTSSINVELGFAACCIGMKVYV